MWRWGVMVLMLLGSSTASWADDRTYEELRDSQDWKQLADRHTEFGSVEVYVAYLGKVPCLRAETQLPITPLQLVDVVADIEGALTWGDDALKVSAIVESGPGWATWHQHAEMPGWTFLNDRFWFLRASFEEQGDTWVIRWASADSPAVQLLRDAELVTDAKAVEPPVNYGGWTLTPTETGLKGRYDLCVDGGGAIPMGMQRWVSTRTLPKGMEDIVKEAQRRSAAGLVPSRRWTSK
jgi:hypothetical protein